MRLWLASESPRRAALLRRTGIPFVVESAAVTELTAGFPMRELPLRNAMLKADAVARNHPDDWVLGADTVILLDDRIFGKPRDPAEAADFLRLFSGRMHEVLTGVSLVCRNAGRREDFTATTRVWFKPLTSAVIAEYLRKVAVLDKAGAYAIQEHGELLIDHIEGDGDNVVGLPAAAVAAAFHRLTDGAAPAQQQAVRRSTIQ